MTLTLAKLNFSIELECGGYNAQVLQKSYNTLCVMVTVSEKKTIFLV